MIQRNLADQLDQWHSTRDPGNPTFAGDWRGDRWSVTTRHQDQIGYQIEQISCEFDKKRRLDSKQVAAMAQEIEQRLRYLLEPIRLIELDPLDAVANLKSDPPSPSEGSVKYFDAWLSTNKFQLRRYQARQGSCPKRVDFQMTRETFVKLTDDLSQMIGLSQRMVM